VLAELPHEGDAELADLVVRLALGVKVAATLGSAHVQAGKGILEDLLETQELEDGQVDCRVQAETALVWTEGRVELDAVALVDIALALVVLPDNAELDDALGDGNDFECLLVLGVLLEDGGALEGGGELWDELADVIDCQLKHLREKSDGQRPRVCNYTYPCRLAQTRAQTLWYGGILELG
jgi:hypothetical protein